MKKILFSATVDSHINHFHLPYLKWFQEQGYKVHVATNGDEKIQYCDVKHKIAFERNPLKINNIIAIKELNKLIKKEKFDIIHCHTPMGGVVTRIAAIKARKKQETKVIYTAHGFHFFKGAPLINWIIYYPIEKILANFTDCLITINQEDYDLAKKKFKAKRIELVNGVGVDINKFNFNLSDKEKSVLRKKLGLKEKDFVIIYVAELNKNKNQIMIIEAIKELVKTNNKIKLLLVGKGKLEKFYKNKIKECNLQNNILLLGYRKDVPELLKISNLYVSTSKREGLPLNIVEAQMCDLPIIATNCRGNRDLIEKENIIEFDISQLKEKIEHIIANKEKVINNNFKRYELNTVLEEMTKIYTREELN